ncbi:MAG: DUF4304 domain-containing protein [Verrucomicrobiota bacterium]
MSKERFFHELKTEFSPKLREVGFKGSGQNFYRILGDTIQIINIQGNKYGGSFAVNLAIQPVNLKLQGDTEFPNPKKIKEYECLFRKRLTPRGKSDYWWKYQGFLTNPEKSAANLIQCYFNIGESHFQHYSKLSVFLEELDLAQLSERTSVIVADDYLVIARAAMIAAWIYESQGNITEAVRYAQFGLEHNPRAKGLNLELRRITKLAGESSPKP